jgi:hypothetical protein
MAYFSPEDWTEHVKESDLMKIRGLILRKLFRGWCNEARNLKHARFKAGQTLSRVNYSPL